MKPITISNNPGPVFHAIKGGTIIWGSPTASDPCGTNLYVRCDKHAGYMRVEYGIMEATVENVQRAAELQLRECPGCREEAARSTTRFPEGAEL
jgi:hypothetical protein